MVDIADLPFSGHGKARLFGRRFSVAGVGDVLSFGREVHARGAVVYAVGKREVVRARKQGVDISDLEGWHIVCGHSGAILTVYKNRSLRRLRPVYRTRNNRF